MTTVRFSKELQDRILSAARGKMQPAIDRAKEAKPDNSWGTRIYHTMFGDVLPVLSQLPDGWVKKVETLEVERVGSTRCSLSFTLAQPMPWPMKFTESEYAKKEYSYQDSVVLKDHLVWGELFAEVSTQNDKIRAAEQRRDEFVESVKKVIEAYTTLAPALKAWPALWELIPEDVKEKHREIKERTKKGVEIDVDFDKLTAIATAAKFGV